MRVRLVRRPGQHGTRPYVEQHGDRLVCVRYRYDEAARRRYKTIEIIVDEQPWEPRGEVVRETKPVVNQPVPRRSIRAKTLVGVRIQYGESDLYARLRDVRAGWIPQLHAWVISYEQAVDLGLTDRIAGTIAELSASH